MLFLIKLALITAGFYILLIIIHVRKRKTQPPGPIGFPIVGMLPIQIFQTLFAKRLPKVSQRKLFRQMKEKYGDYWAIQLGSQRVVTFASLDIVNEAYVNNGKLFVARPINDTFKMFNGFHGVVFSNEGRWMENRQKTVKALRQFGMGKRDLEHHVSYETKELIKYLASISSEPINTSMIFIKTAANVIGSIVFNKIHSYHDAEYEGYLKNVMVANQSNAINTKCSIFPTLSTTKLARYLFPDVDEFYTSFVNMNNYSKKRCEQRIKAIDERADPECVFDYLWKHRKQDNLNSEEIFQSMSDLTFAGSETLNNFFQFCLLVLGRYQDVQDDLRKEITCLTEDYNLINMDMRKQCPKLLSFVDEIHRFYTILPKPPRAVTTNCTFMGYKLYREDIIFADWGTISRDPNLFPNPDVFDPYRFLDESKTKYVLNKSLIPFGLGKRACLGEGVATMQTFLTLSSIILCFRISLTNETLQKFDDITEGNIGFTHCPKPHDLNLQIIDSIKI